MVGTVFDEQPVGSIMVGVSHDGSAGQEGLEVQSLASGGSCTSCGARIGHDAALCPWCGRVVLHDPVFDSDGASARHCLGPPTGALLAPGSSALLAIPEGTSTWR